MALCLEYTHEPGPIHLKVLVYWCIIAHNNIFQIQQSFSCCWSHVCWQAGQNTHSDRKGGQIIFIYFLLSVKWPVVFYYTDGKDLLHSSRLSIQKKHHTELARLKHKTRCRDQINATALTQMLFFFYMYLISFDIPPHNFAVFVPTIFSYSHLESTFVKLVISFTKRNTRVCGSQESIMLDD